MPRFPDANPASPGCAAALLLLAVLVTGCVHGHPVPVPAAGAGAVAHD